MPVLTWTLLCISGTSPPLVDNLLVLGIKMIMADHLAMS